LEYPSNFDVPSFPAGKRIAVSRFMSIGIFVLFLLIIFMCGILFWVSRSKKIDPFLISTNDVTGQWVDVGHFHGSGLLEFSTLRTMQESVVGNFAANWFIISEDPESNEALWKTCDRYTGCIGENTPAYGNNECAIFCITGEELFSKFIYEIVPDYQDRFANGERWTFDKANMQIEPAGNFSSAGGTWLLHANIKSNMSEDINIVAFVKIARNPTYYPQNLGYYVADFNAYKIN